MSCAKIKIQESFSPLRASPTFMEIRCALNFQQRSWIPDCIEVIKSGKIFRALTFLWSFSRSCVSHIFLTLCHLAYDLSKKKFFATKEGKKAKDLRFRVKSRRGTKIHSWNIPLCKIECLLQKGFCTVNEKSPKKTSQLLLKLAEFSSLWMKLFRGSKFDVMQQIAVTLICWFLG